MLWHISPSFFPSLQRFVAGGAWPTGRPNAAIEIRWRRPGGDLQKRGSYIRCKVALFVRLVLPPQCRGCFGLMGALY